MPDPKIPAPTDPPPDGRTHVPNPYWGTHGEPGEDTEAQEPAEE